MSGMALSWPHGWRVPTARDTFTVPGNLDVEPSSGHDVIPKSSASATICSVPWRGIAEPGATVAPGPKIETLTNQSSPPRPWRP